MTETSNVVTIDDTCYECGSIEVTIQQFQYIAANENASTTKTKKRNVPARALSKPINQLSTIIRRNRNKSLANRGISSSQTGSSVGSDYVATSISNQENDKNKSNTIVTRSSSSKVLVGNNKSNYTNAIRPVRSSSDITMTRGDEILLVLSSVSEDDPNCNSLSHDNKIIISKSLVPSATSVTPSTKLVKSKSENDLTTFQNLYNIMTSWGENNQDNDGHQNIITCLPASTTNSTNDEFDDNDTKLVRRNSSLTIDPVSSQSSFFMNEDFDSSNWLEVNAPSGISILGAAVMTATVVIHPFIFVAGAATAVWAVGLVHGLEQG